MERKEEDRQREEHSGFEGNGTVLSEVVEILFFVLLFLKLCKCHIHSYIHFIKSRNITNLKNVKSLNIKPYR